MSPTSTSSSTNKPPSSSSSSPRHQHHRSTHAAAHTTAGVLDFLRRAIPRDKLLELFVEPDRGRFVCRAVLQQLSELAQQVVIRLTCTAGSFPAAGVQVWTSLSATQQDLLFWELYEWAILKDHLRTATIAAGAVVAMTEQFFKGIQAALASLDASPWTALQPIQIQALQEEAETAAAKVPEPLNEQVTPEDLERYTQTQWDTVLHYLVGTTGHQKPPGPIIDFLLQTGLMQPDPEFDGDPDDAIPVITEKGYDFMLQDNHEQVWHFVGQYLSSLESHKKGAQLRREALLLLVCLSFARVGEAYLASSLNKDSRVMVKDLALFGLLYTRRIGRATIFYPTRVAMQLVGTQGTTNGEATAATRTTAIRSTASSAAANTLWSLSSKALETALAHPRPHDSSHLAIIVQTNFQVCAYTTSELHVSMLGLFCDIKSIRRLPNIVFMRMTRDSVKMAFAFGIQARQILRFLEKHAHPKLRTASAGGNAAGGNSPIPANVVDQVWLWDRERTRVQLTEVYEHHCMLEGEFQAVLQYTKKHGAHAWSSERRRTILVNYEEAERVQKFARQWRAKTAARQAHG